MTGRECYHCKQWIEAGTPHNCWSTTEAALTAGLSDDLREAWERLRETAAEFGEQRIYASLNSIMFSRKACYVFVRPKTKFLEVCFFLGRTVKAPQIKRAMPASKVKVAHLVQVRHRDEVEPPLTDWMREAYETSDALSSRTLPGGPDPSTRSGSSRATSKDDKVRPTTVALATTTPASKARKTKTTGSRRPKTSQSRSPARARSTRR